MAHAVIVLCVWWAVVVPLTLAATGDNLRHGLRGPWHADIVAPFAENGPSALSFSNTSCLADAGGYAAGTYRSNPEDHVALFDDQFFVNDTYLEVHLEQRTLFASDSGRAMSMPPVILRYDILEWYATSVNISSPTLPHPTCATFFTRPGGTLVLHWCLGSGVLDARTVSSCDDQLSPTGACSAAPTGDLVLGCLNATLHRDWDSDVGMFFLGAAGPWRTESVGTRLLFDHDAGFGYKCAGAGEPDARVPLQLNLTMPTPWTGGSVPEVSIQAGSEHARVDPSVYPSTNATNLGAGFLLQGFAEGWQEKDGLTSVFLRDSQPWPFPSPERRNMITVELIDGNHIRMDFCDGQELSNHAETQRQRLASGTTAATCDDSPPMATCLETSVLTRTPDVHPDLLGVWEGNYSMPLAAVLSGPQQFPQCRPQSEVVPVRLNVTATHIHWERTDGLSGALVWKEEGGSVWGHALEDRGTWDLISFNHESERFPGRMLLYAPTDDLSPFRCESFRHDPVANTFSFTWTVRINTYDLHPYGDLCPTDAQVAAGVTEYCDLDSGTSRLESAAVAHLVRAPPASAPPPPPPPASTSPVDDVDFASPASSYALTAYWLLAVAVVFVLVSLWKRSQSRLSALKTHEWVVRGSVWAQLRNEHSLLGMLLVVPTDLYTRSRRILLLVATINVQLITVIVEGLVNVDQIESANPSFEARAGSFLLSFAVGTVVSLILGAETMRRAMQPIRPENQTPARRKQVLVLSCIVTTLLSAVSVALLFLQGLTDIAKDHVDTKGVVGSAATSVVFTWVLSEPVFLILKRLLWLQATIPRYALSRSSQVAPLSSHSSLSVDDPSSLDVDDRSSLDVDDPSSLDDDDPSSPPAS